jgi:hypothetical protein
MFMHYHFGTHTRTHIHIHTHTHTHTHSYLSMNAFFSMSVPVKTPRRISRRGPGIRSLSSMNLLTCDCECVCVCVCLRRHQQMKRQYMCTLNRFLHIHTHTPSSLSHTHTRTCLENLSVRALSWFHTSLNPSTKAVSSFLRRNSIIRAVAGCVCM